MTSKWALSTIQYTVELDMNWKMILIPGQRVVHISSEARGHIVKRLVSIEDVESGFDYDFETEDGDKYPVRREDIKVPPVRRWHRILFFLRPALSVISSTVQKMTCLLALDKNSSVFFSDSSSYLIQYLQQQPQPQQQLQQQQRHHKE